MKSFFPCLSLLSLVGSVFALGAACGQSLDATPLAADPSTSSVSPSAGGVQGYPFLRVSPRSLSEQRLSPSTYPLEAEIYCGTGPCLFGLSRDVVVGSRVLDMLYAPLKRYTDATSGSASVVDAFVGVQVLKDASRDMYATAQAGYRRVGFTDGDTNLSRQGMTLDVNYTQRITPVFTQGLQFAGFFVFGSETLNQTSWLSTTNSNHARLNDAANSFYRLLRPYPTYRVSLTSDVEIVNWSPAQTRFEKPLRGYLHIAPFYAQNDVMFHDSSILVKKSEQNFGLRTTGIASYESSEGGDKAGRYALKGEVGFEIASSQFSSTSTNNADLSLTRRPVLAPCFEFSVAYQF